MVNFAGEAIRGAGRMLVAALVLASIAGCGVRGALERPPAETATPTASADSGQGKAEGAAPKPHEGFILDRLIR